jgi:transcription elongation factor GreB
VALHLIKSHKPHATVFVIKASIVKTNLITLEGLNKLTKELNYLWREYRPEITKKVAWAASLGDRSENADYKENKRLLRQIDGRVRFLRKRIEALKVVEYAAEQEGKIFFGAWVEIENDDGDIKRFRIVGPDEIYGDAKGYISIDSPMARALLKKEIDDEAAVPTPVGEQIWYVNKISYKAPLNAENSDDANTNN